MWKRLFAKIRSRLASTPPNIEFVTHFADDLLPKIGEEVPYPKDKESFIVKTALGRGAFGAVYEVQRNDKTFAMKCEKASIRQSIIHVDLAVMMAMKGRNSKHFAKAIEKGRMPGRFAYLVMQMLGKDLKTLRKDRDPQRFSLNTSIKLAEQCLVAIENLHRAGFLHRDIKPANFAMGIKGDDHTVFMLDFGLAKPFTNEEKTVRAPRKDGKAPFRGSVLYAPMATHYQIEQSRKDDLESMMYMVVEWTSGKLPWNDRKRSWEDEGDWVVKAKQDVYLEDAAKEVFYELCPRKKFEQIMKYLVRLEYTDIPDYKFIYLTLNSIYIKNRINYADPIDWDPSTPYHGPQETPGDGIPRPKDEEEKMESNRQKSISEKEANSNMKTPTRPTSRTVSTMSSPSRTPQCPF